MNGRTEFREGRWLVVADLQRESAVHTADTARHAAVAHSGGATPPLLVGNTVAHPAGLPRVDLTREGRQRAVRVVLRGTRPDLELGVYGGHRATGSVTSSGSQVQAEGAVRLLSGPALTPSVPWSVRALDVADDTGRVVARELRVELSAPPGSPPAQSRMAVGTVAGQQPFRPALTVDAAGTVTVPGDLAVAGAVSQGEIPANLDDRRFREQLADVVARRVLATATSTSAAILRLTVTPGTGSAEETPFTVGFKPSVALVRWGAALEVKRGGTSEFVLLDIGGPVIANEQVSVPAEAVPWSPPLSTQSPGQLVVAVVAYVASGAVHAQRLATASLTG
jgi:hypothetical protein